jgi:hypothetical protein
LVLLVLQFNGGAAADLIMVQEVNRGLWFAVESEKVLWVKVE